MLIYAKDPHQLNLTFHPCEHKVSAYRLLWFLLNKMWLWSHIFEEMKEPKFHIFLNPSLASLGHSSTNGVINNFGNPNADKHSNVIGSFEQGVTTNPIHNHYNLQPLYLESFNPKTNLRCSMACPTCSPKCTFTSLIYQSPFLNLPMRFVTSVTWNLFSLRSNHPKDPWHENSHKLSCTPILPRALYLICHTTVSPTSSWWCHITVSEISGISNLMRENAKKRFYGKQRSETTKNVGLNEN